VGYPTNIVDGGGTSHKARVTHAGELVVAIGDDSTFHTASTASNNVAVNVVPPLPGKNFIITAIILSGDRSIGVNGAITDVFEADTDTSGTIDTQIYQDEIGKQDRAVIPALHIKVSAGKWVNVKSDDVIVRANIAGYYESAISD